MKQNIPNVSTHPVQTANVVQFLCGLLVAQALNMWIEHVIQHLTLGGSLIALAYGAWLALLTVLTANMKDGHEEYNGALCLVFLVTIFVCGGVTIVRDVPGPTFSAIGAIVGGLLAKLFTRPLWRRK